MTETVQLFVTCILDTLYPQVGEAMEIIEQKCAMIRSSEA